MPGRQKQLSTSGIDHTAGALKLLFDGGSRGCDNVKTLAFVVL